MKKHDRDLADQLKRACWDAAVAWGWPLDDRQARVHLKRVQGMSWGLVHGPKHLRQR